ncbi:anti-sigma factor [Mucilaginibacter glaciei]|uniref:Uncharacterized protein n=1 Tax=Mucilaginibacter glaciei TaxID=2772109 RepID=A0A926NQR2_9SPHI|nr:hypothetical protein [Mucilaginibacter glaciei]MBD1393648.1 hypothetical protein [Mucilaginibacter glaciei]
MSSIEEKLWDYIDGFGTAEERQAVAKLIADDEAYGNKYRGLIKLNAEFAAIEVDEPSMAFTYKVMETIRTEHAQQPLKATVNRRIIWGIAAFFILTITALVIFAFGSADWHATANMKLPDSVSINKVPDLFTAPVVKGFLFFDVVLGLFLLDAYLRRKSVAKHP